LGAAPNSAFQRAGADDIENGRDHNPAYNQVDVPDELLLLLPGMQGVLEIRDELKRRDKEIRDKNERLEESLDTRLLNVLAFIHDISRALQVSAARPVNPDTFELLENEPTMREKYRYGLMSGVYDLELFDSSEYREFGAKIRAAEDAAAALRKRLKGKTPAEAEILDQLKEIRNEMRQLMRDLLTGNASPQESVDESPQESADTPPRDEVIEQPKDLSCAPMSAPPPPKPSCRPIIPLPPFDLIEFTKKGELRKVKASIPADYVKYAETPRNISRVVFTHSDNHCKSMKDHWLLYKTRWEPLEKQCLALGYKEDE
jgi:hypothetical protein